MNKFKFGDKVWRDGELFVVWQSAGSKTECLTQNGLIEVYDTEALTLVADEGADSEWIKCAERMPDCDELREKPQEALFWIYCQIEGRHFVTRAYRQFHSKKWAWVDKLTTEGQMTLFDDAVTHYMPIIKPAPPQD